MSRSVSPSYSDISSLNHGGSAAQSGSAGKLQSAEYPREAQSNEYPQEKEPQTGETSRSTSRDDALKKVPSKNASPEDMFREELSPRGLSPKDDPSHAPPCNKVARRDESANCNESANDSDFAELERRAHVALEYLSINGAADDDEDDGEADRVAAYMETLREYRRRCQARELYVEADLVQQVLRHLHLDEETRHVRGLTEQQMREREALEEAHREEFRSFHSVWNARIDELEETQAELETTLLERQNEELQAFNKEIQEGAPYLLHASRGVIHTRAVQHILAAQRQYAQAHRTKLHADRLEARDTERFMKSTVEHFERREAALRLKHEQERSVLSMKMDRRRAELERARKKELDVLLRRYVNVRRELELQQNIVRNKTGTILLKHANNTKSDASGSATLVESAVSGAFGWSVQRRHADESSARSHMQSAGTR